MKEKGRLSQTETEDSDEEDADEEDTKDAKKKKGRKAGAVASTNTTLSIQSAFLVTIHLFCSIANKKGKRKGETKAEEKKAAKKKGNVVGSSSSSKGETASTPAANLLPAFGVPQEVLDMPVDPNEPTYCLCQQVHIIPWADLSQLL